MSEVPKNQKAQMILELKGQIAQVKSWLRGSCTLDEKNKYRRMIDERQAYIYVIKDL